MFTNFTLEKVWTVVSRDKCIQWFDNTFQHSLIKIVACWFILLVRWKITIDKFGLDIQVSWMTFTVKCSGAIEMTSQKLMQHNHFPIFWYHGTRSSSVFYYDGQHFLLLLFTHKWKHFRIHPLFCVNTTQKMGKLAL